MHQPPLHYRVFACPRCAGEFTIKWVHPASSAEYNLAQLNCPHCDTLHPSHALQPAGRSIPAMEANHGPLLRAEHPRKVPTVTPPPLPRQAASPPRVSPPRQATTRVTVASAPVQVVSSPRPAASTDHAPSPPPSAEQVQCAPLMEACTLDLYQKNIFRITGLPVDASAKDIAKQAQRLQMLEEMGGTSQAAFATIPAPTADEIRDALARLKEPEHRLIDELFWYWPEEFGKSKQDEAIQAVLIGDGEKAFALWTQREQSGTSTVARHNLAVLFHMYALDWTNHHIDPGREEKIKSFWRDSAERWQNLHDADPMWDVLKERVRTVDDHALTTGFVRRMRHVLPQALTHIHAGAALKFAMQGRMDWAEFHVDAMRQILPGQQGLERTVERVLEPTRKRLKQQVNTAREQSLKAPAEGPQIATELMTQSTPCMVLYDLLLGSHSAQRQDLFDEVADTVLSILVKYRKGPHSDETIIALLGRAVGFASGHSVRDELTRATSIIKGDLSFKQLKPHFDQLEAIKTSNHKPEVKLLDIVRKLLPALPNVAKVHGSRSEAFTTLSDNIAIVLRNLAIDAHNDFYDYETAEKAIHLALRLAADEKHKTKFRKDVTDLAEGRKNITCSVCKTARPTAGCDLTLQVSSLSPQTQAKLPPDILRKGHVKLPRCRACHDKQVHGSSGSGCLVLLAGVLTFAAVAVLGLIWPG